MFTSFGMQAGCFYFGALFIEQDFPDLKAEDVFTSLFCIMFSAMFLGSALSLGLWPLTEAAHRARC